MPREWAGWVDVILDTSKRCCLLPADTITRNSRLIFIITNPTRRASTVLWWIHFERLACLLLILKCPSSSTRLPCLVSPSRFDVCIFTSLLYIVNNDEEIHSSRLSFLPFSTHIKTMLFLHYLSSLSGVALIHHVKLCCVEVNVVWRMSVRGGKWQKKGEKKGWKQLKSLLVNVLVNWEMRFMK